MPPTFALTKTMPPETPVREAQHRVRNDLQTLSALLRLSSRRTGNAEALLAEIPGWLNVLAAVYDAIPLCGGVDTVPASTLVRALCERCDFGASIVVGEDDGAHVAAVSAAGFALALMELLAFSSKETRLGGGITVNIRRSTSALHVEAVFPAGPRRGGVWPPAALGVVVEAMAGRLALGPDGDDTVAVLVVPCR